MEKVVSPQESVDATDKVFSFHDTVAGISGPLTLILGTNTLDSSAVPAGMFWRITTCSIILLGTAPTVMEIQAVIDGTAGSVDTRPGVARPNVMTYNGDLFLGPGDKLRARLEGCTANDTLYLAWHGIESYAP